ncbi:hypothetical protein, partial [Chitinivibrio alkaliphilus]|uniref:hypothetical protein n=1 Tax=Chitinivibrio alkaliphilus TaxID=1505232 RepID=UPI0012DD421E
MPLIEDSIFISQKSDSIITEFYQDVSHTNTKIIDTGEQVTLQHQDTFTGSFDLRQYLTEAHTTHEIYTEAIELRGLDEVQNFFAADSANLENHEDLKISEFSIPFHTKEFEYARFCFETPPIKIHVKNKSTAAQLVSISLIVETRHYSDTFQTFAESMDVIKPGEKDSFSLHTKDFIMSNEKTSLKWRLAFSGDDTLYAADISYSLNGQLVQEGMLHDRHLPDSIFDQIALPFADSIRFDTLDLHRYILSTNISNPQGFTSDLLLEHHKKPFIPDTISMKARTTSSYSIRKNDVRGLPRWDTQTHKSIIDI